MNPSESIPHAFEGIPAASENIFSATKSVTKSAKPLGQPRRGRKARPLGQPEEFYLLFAHAKLNLADKDPRQE